MDVSAVNDICNGMYIHRQKVLSRVSYLDTLYFDD